jgi:hypothetical protein
MSNAENLVSILVSGNARLFNIFEVRNTVNERGEAGDVLGYCSSQPAAEVLAKGSGWWGGDGQITPAYGLLLAGKVWALREPDPINLLDLDEVLNLRPRTQSEIDEALRRSAAAKLTPDERKAVGLDA